MSNDEVHAILRAPRKLIIALAAIACGSGGMSIIAHFSRSHDAELADCRAIVDEHAAHIAELESRRVIAPFRRLEPRNSEYSSMLGRGGDQ